MNFKSERANEMYGEMMNDLERDTRQLTTMIGGCGLEILQRASALMVIYRHRFECKAIAIKEATHVDLLEKGSSIGLASMLTPQGDAGDQGKA